MTLVAKEVATVEENEHKKYSVVQNRLQRFSIAPRFIDSWLTGAPKLV
jgi:hypothetical protein